MYPREGAIRVFRDIGLYEDKGKKKKKNKKKRKERHDSIYLLIIILSFFLFVLLLALYAFFHSMCRVRHVNLA